MLTFILKKKEWSNFIVPLFKIKNSKISIHEKNEKEEEKKKRDKEFSDHLSKLKDKLKKEEENLLEGKAPEEREEKIFKGFAEGRSK